jgi:hypothetical protein
VCCIPRLTGLSGDPGIEPAKMHDTAPLTPILAVRPAAFLGEASCLEQRMDPAVYNYETFDGYVSSGAEQREFAAWPNVLHAGQPAPEIAGTLLDDGSALSLPSVWKRRNVVVEFGSFT